MGFRSRSEYAEHGRYSIDNLQFVIKSLEEAKKELADMPREPTIAVNNYSPGCANAEVRTAIEHVFSASWPSIQAEALVALDDRLRTLRRRLKDMAGKIANG